MVVGVVVAVLLGRVWSYDLPPFFSWNLYSIKRVLEGLTLWSTTWSTTLILWSTSSILWSTAFDLTIYLLSPFCRNKHFWPQLGRSWGQTLLKGKIIVKHRQKGGLKNSNLMISPPLKTAEISVFASKNESYDLPKFAWKERQLDHKIWVFWGLGLWSA